MALSEYEEKILHETELLDFELPAQRDHVVMAAKMGGLFALTGAGIFQGGITASEYMGGKLWVEVTAAGLSAPAVALGILGLTAAGIEGVQYLRQKHEANKLY